ncbi:hypothetical protein SEUCBS139899_000897 [Sporothrix eucalyptigena]|uniref:Zn(2)-C6 fungal-type domain-containing protein n=1 Tax=Sporothrix eucalyptigena TaxID=1812306 RepID=A0ABP0BKC4_9PEZI
MCDELRPSCTRCIKGRHACPGYKDEAEIIFRHWARPEVPVHVDVNDAEIETHALDIFMHEFVVEPADRALSRGFLDGMPALLSRAGPNSVLANAAKLMALACVANQQRRVALLSRLDNDYCLLLRRFHESLAAEGDHVTLASLYTAVLLGLYEIISETESSPKRQVTHVQGVGAILVSGASYLDWDAGAPIHELGIPLLLKLTTSDTRTHGILRASAHSPTPPLDAIMISFWQFLNRVSAVLDESASSKGELAQLRHEAETLEQRFTLWSASQNSERSAQAPTTAGVVSEQAAGRSAIPYCHSGAVDVYLDYYVATVWNTYRKSHIYILDVMMQIDARLDAQVDSTDLKAKAEDITTRVIATIPFLLAHDVAEYLTQVRSGSSRVRANRPVGGLLLLHPLYCLATNPIVSLATRQYCARCLAWIGSHMGIGQAAVLARTLDGESLSARLNPDPRLPFQFMSESNNLIWAGMLLQGG